MWKKYSICLDSRKNHFEILSHPVKMTIIQKQKQNKTKKKKKQPNKKHIATSGENIK
jgi:hypothetical protein